MSDPLWINTAADVSVGTATIDASTDLFTITGHDLVNGDRVVVSNLTGGAVGVLAENGIYWVRDVATDVFAVSLTKSGLAIDFSSNGGADVEKYQPAYNAPELRRAIGGLLFQAGTADRFGAREGILPSQSLSAVTLVSSTWTVADIRAVVYPGISTDDGPYIVQHAEESGSLDPADGTNDRIDALDLQIQDHDEDASGQRRARIVYVSGTPDISPVAPPLTTNSFRLATILVPAGGTPSPSVQTQALMTAAAGGVIVVRDDTELPVNPTSGNLAFNLDTSALVARQAGVWETLGNTQGYQFGGRLVFTADTTFVKGDHPGLRAIDVQIKGGGGGAGGCGATDGTQASEGGGGGGGAYARKFITADLLGSSETITIGQGGAGATAGANTGGTGGTTTFTISDAGTADLVANGGGGGDGMAGTSSQATAFSGVGGARGSGGDLDISGDSGGNGRVTGGAGTSIRANWGGGGPLTRVVLTSAVDSNGASGARYGGGASGPRNGVNEVARGGQDGNNGVCIVDLYF